MEGDAAMPTSRRPGWNEWRAPPPRHSVELDTETVQRIVEQARIGTVSDRESLRKGLSIAVTVVIPMVQVRMPTSEDQAARLDKIYGAAQNLLKALGCDQSPELPELTLWRVGGAMAWSPNMPRILERSPETDARLRQMVDGIKEISRSAKVALDYIDKYMSPGRPLTREEAKALGADRSRLLFVWLILDAYRKATGRSPGKGVNGPAIRFVMAAIDELLACHDEFARHFGAAPSAETLKSWIGQYLDDQRVG